MISRIWRGWTTARNADDYEILLRDEVIPAIIARQIAGFRHIEVLRVSAGDEVEFMTVMWFDNIEAIRAFAGKDYEMAVVPPRARGLLKHFDERVRQYNVRLSRGAG
jgi:antibiotic biosynthesis monooxygenase (ABM) superfamily enzyme